MNNLELLKNIEAFDFNWDVEVEAIKEYEEKDFIDVIEYIEENIEYMKYEILDNLDYSDESEEFIKRNRELLKLIAKNIKIKNVINLEYISKYRKIYSEE